MRKAKATSDERDRADRTGDADTGSEKLEHQQRQPGDEQEVRDPRRVERVRELLAEIEFAEAHDLVVLNRPVRGHTDNFRRRHAYVAGGGVQHATVQPDDELAECRISSVDQSVGLGGSTRQTMRDFRPVGMFGDRLLGGARQSERVVEVDGYDRPDVGAGSHRDVRRGEREQGAGPPGLPARRSDPHRDGNRAVAYCSHQRVRVDVDGAGPVELEDEQRRSSVRRVAQ